jgi:hypothetical protein
LQIFFIVIVLSFIGFHVIRYIYHSLNPEAKKEFLRKKTEKRIEADFPRHEKECRKKHNQKAESKFSILRLQKKVDKFVIKIESEASSIFKNNISNVRSRITKLKLKVQNKQKTLDLFRKNYKEILDSLYTQRKLCFLKKDNIYDNQKLLQDKLKVAFIEKDEAYDTLNDCKDSIDSWYAMSNRTPWLFGNGGNKIPNHSMFGQSFGDLDSYKDDRDKAYHDVELSKEKIGNLKSEIGQNKRNIDQLKQEIVNINLNIKKFKDERTRIYELKKDGITKASTKIEIDKLILDLKTEQSELDAQELAEKDFVFKKRKDTGVIDLEDKIRVILIQKEKFIAEFDSNKNHLSRINEHRTFWFKNNKW